MMEDKIFFDVETLPTLDPDLIADIAAGITPPGSMKKPETIAKWEAEERPAAIAKAIAKTSLDGGTGRVASIAWAVGAGEILAGTSAGDDGYHEAVERQLIAGFFDECQAVFAQYRSQPVLVGHNILGFDLRWLWKRAIVLGIAVPDWWPLHAKSWSQDVFDTMTAWEGHGGRISQDRLARILGVGEKGDVDGSKIAALWAAGQYETVRLYNADDVETVRRIWGRITQHDGQLEPDVQAPEPGVAVVEVTAAPAAKFFADDEELAEPVVDPVATVEAPPARETASEIVEAGMRACLRPGAPMPFTSVLRARKTKAGAAAVVILFDGREGTVEVERMKIDPDAWHIRWLDVAGGAISLEGDAWVRVPDDAETSDADPGVKPEVVEEKPVPVASKPKVIPVFLREKYAA